MSSCLIMAPLLTDVTSTPSVRLLSIIYRPDCCQQPDWVLLLLVLLRQKRRPIRNSGSQGQLWHNRGPTGLGETSRRCYKPCRDAYMLCDAALGLSLLAHK